MKKSLITMMLLSSFVSGSIGGSADLKSPQVYIQSNGEPTSLIEKSAAKEDVKKLNDFVKKAVDKMMQENEEEWDRWRSMQEGHQ